MRVRLRLREQTWLDEVRHVGCGSGVVLVDGTPASAAPLPGLRCCCSSFVIRDFLDSDHVLDTEMHEIGIHVLKDALTLRELREAEVRA